MKFKYTFVVIFSLICTYATSQNLGTSPYSKIGVGDILNPITVQGLGMGGVSVSTYNQDYIHLMNPAASTNKKGHYADSLVKIEGAYTIQSKTMYAATTSDKVMGSNLRYIAMSFPLGKRWNTTLALQPFSMKLHSFTQTEPVANDPNGLNVKYNFEGKGGMYQIAFNNGWGISKSLSAGLGLAYLFGPSTTTITSQLITDPTAEFQNETSFGISRKINHKSLAIKPGLHYRKQIQRAADTTKVFDGIFMNIGATVELFTTLNMSVEETLIRTSAINQTSNDTVINSFTQHGELPARFNFGFSFDRPHKWMAGLEGGFSNWKKGFRYIEEPGQQYQLGWNIGIGGEIRPNAKKQWRAWIYRIGARYEQLPYTVSGISISDISGSVGVSIPVGVRGHGGASLPKINAAFVFGQRGTTQNNLIREVYMRVQLSILITDKWFTRRKYN
jgi:hypothetical protein